MFYHSSNTEENWEAVDVNQLLSDYRESVTQTILNYLYLCVWGEGYSNVTPIEVDIDQFDEIMGYSSKSIGAVWALPFGARLDLSDESGEHFVTRIK